MTQIAPAQEQRFQAPREVAVGQSFAGPYAVVAADFNGDGKPDLAVGDYDDGSVTILPGTGDGNFGRMVRIAAAGSVRQMVAVDLDGDGNNDLVAACSSKPSGESGASYQVVLLLGHGDGTFREPERIQVPTELWAVLAQDLDGDGIPDLAVGQAGKILLLTGKGDGTFRDAVELPTPYQEYGDNSPVLALRAGDVNLDAKPDLIAVHRATGAVSLLLSTPEGGYQGRVLTPGVDGYTHDVAVADFDQDGKPDIALCGDGGCRVLAGNGDGTFREAGSADEPARTMAVAVGDLNGDGAPDLILGNYYGGKISVMLGRGNATFEEAPFVQTKGDTFGVVIVDLNGDGKADLAAANRSSHSITVGLGQGEGRFGRPLILASSVPVFAVADLDGDGKSDLAIANGMTDTVDVLRGAADPAGSYTVDPNPSSLLAADLNNDGIPDLVAPGGRRGDGGSWLEYSSLLLGTGGGQFRAGPTITGLVAAVADFNQDGHADLVMRTSTLAIQVALGRGDGTFEPAGEFQGVSDPRSIVVADLNHDGLLDLAAISSQGLVLVFLSKGDGTFQTGVPYSAGSQPATILVADFTGDGIPDLAVPGAGSVCILPGLGDGSFRQERCTPLGAAPSYNRFFAVCDFDEDGRTDLAVAETAWVPPDYSIFTTVWLYRGAGDGNFDTGKKAYTSPAGSRITALAAADFDGDGRADLAAGLYDDSKHQGTVLILN